MPTDILSELDSSCPSGMDSAEWRARVELAACYRVFDHFGWCELIFNHITLRVPGEKPAYLINPFGFIIHSAVHASRADAHCVMHTHTTAGMAVACKRDGLGHDDFYGAQLGGDVAYHAFEGITVHEGEGPRLVGVHQPLRDLETHHLDAVLPLPVGAAQQPESTPLIGGDLAALEFRQVVRELVDVRRLGEREARAA